MPINTTAPYEPLFICESCDGLGYYLVDLGAKQPCKSCNGLGHCPALKAATSEQPSYLGETVVECRSLECPFIEAVTASASDTVGADYNLPCPICLGPVKIAEIEAMLNDNDDVDAPGQCGKAEAADRASIDADFIDGDDDDCYADAWDDADDDSTDEYSNGAEVNCDCDFCTEGRADSLAVELAHNARSFDDCDSSDDIPF